MKPILFNTEMTRATLEDRKTQTRRVVKPQPPQHARLEFSAKYGVAFDYAASPFPMPDEKISYNPLYQAGDILYVRETWSTRISSECYAQPCHTGRCPYESCESATGPCFPEEYIYKATDNLTSYGGKWHPSIHMPKEAARLFLQVTDIHVERLQESFFCHGATVRNLAAEGIDIGDQCRECIGVYGSPCCIDEESECGILDDVRDAFATLWDSTIKPANLSIYGWAANPWVWVYEFERCEKPRMP